MTSFRSVSAMLAAAGTFLLFACSSCGRDEQAPTGNIRSVLDDSTRLATKLQAGDIQPAPNATAGGRGDLRAHGRTAEEGVEEMEAEGRPRAGPPRTAPARRPATTTAAPDPTPAEDSAFDRDAFHDVVGIGGGRGGARNGKAATKPRARQPVVWQRSKDRPSFARVHVGDGNSLALERMRVTVTIEGPRARTIVDHVFKNPHEKQLEGTFEYPLPTGASVSYYAMFLSDDQARAPEFFPAGALAELPAGAIARMPPDEAMRRVDERWGKLREARVVVKEKARKVYEEIVRRRIDPALLEYAGGNTFRGRVFPIPAKGYNRVVIAYEQKLDIVDGRTTYRFPLPDCELQLLHVTGTLPRSGVVSESWSPSQGAARKETASRIVYEQAWEQSRGPGGELQWSFRPQTPRVQTITSDDPTSSDRSFYIRVQPDLPATLGEARAGNAVFLLDTSLSEDPDRFRINLKLMRRILARDTAIERFNVLCFDVGAWWIEPGGWLANDEAGRRMAMKQLDTVMLEGATDLGAALGKLGATAWIDATKPLHVMLLSDGQVNWGELDAGRLEHALGTRDVRFFCYRTGLSAENLELFERLTRKGGGIFNVFTEDMVERAALAHRRACLVLSKISVDTEAGSTRDVVVAGRQAALYPGGELVVAGRCRGTTRGTLVLHGTLDGARQELRFPLSFTGKGELAARGWAEIAVQQMLALRHPEVDRLAAAYAQRFRIGSRATSFLVLESDADYEEFGIEEEASKLAVRDVAAFLEERYAKTAVVPRRVAFGRFLRQASERTHLLEQGKDEHVRALFAKLGEDDFDLPAIDSYGPLPQRSQEAAGYLAARAKDRRRADLYLDESRRRMEQGQIFPGLRSLASVVELFPGRSDALRLVGYRLLSMQQPGMAAQLFDQVRAQRPFEPHCYRDLARSLEMLGRPGLAAIYYELLLAGTWHARFGDSLKTVAREEYARLMRGAVRRRSVRGELLELFGDRLEGLAATRTRADLRVTIAWNTDATDVDLWVVEPSGEACGYSHRKTRSGGELLDDLTRGYGPERYQNVAAPAGEYVVLVKYYSPNRNLIAGETHVDVHVVRHAGRPDEESRRFQVILKHEKQSVEVCRIQV